MARGSGPSRRYRSGLPAVSPTVNTEFHMQRPIGRRHAMTAVTRTTHPTTTIATPSSRTSGAIIPRLRLWATSLRWRWSLSGRFAAERNAAAASTRPIPRSVMSAPETMDRKLRRVDDTFRGASQVRRDSTHSPEGVSSVWVADTHRISMCPSRSVAMARAAVPTGLGSVAPIPSDATCQTPSTNVPRWAGWAGRDDRALSIGSGRSLGGQQFGLGLGRRWGGA